MRFFIAAALWFLLLAVSWPLALVLLFLFPLIWLLALPFRLAGLVLNFVVSLVKAILLLPFRIGSALVR